jgi:hypothetical protein
MSGDATINDSGVITLKNTGLAGNYGNSSTSYAAITTDAQGRVTSASSYTFPSSFPPTGTAGGDLYGTYPNPSVIKIQGNTFASGSPAKGQFVMATSTTGYGPVSISGTDVSASATTPGLLTVTGIQGKAASVPSTSGTYLNYNGISLVWTSLPTSLPPSGTASGDLSGSYPGPTVAQIQGVPINSTTPTAGQILIENAGSAGNGAKWTSFTGDVSLSTTTPGQASVTAIRGNTVLATAATAGQFLIENSLANGSAWTSISGDVNNATSSPGTLSVVGIQGNNFSSGSPTKGQFVVATGATSYGPVTLSGDITESATTAGKLTVSALDGYTLPNPGAASNNTVLTYNAGALSWSASSAIFTPGGDLTGTNTSQQVAQISGATGNITFSSTNTAPTIQQTAITSDAVPYNMTIVAQGAFATASSHTTGGALIIEGGASQSGNNGATLILGGGTNGSPETTVSNLYIDTLNIKSTSNVARLVLTAGATPTLYPSTTNTGTLGTSSFLWNNGYFTNLNVTSLTLGGAAIPSPTTGYLNYTGSAWQFSSLPTSFTVGGDLSGTTASATVAKLDGYTLPNPGAASNNTVLTYNAGALSWSTAASGFTAGGDLTGSPSSQQVAKITSATGNLNFAAATASPTLSQTTAATSTSIPQNLTISPQAPNAGASNATYGTPGSFVVSLSAPVNGGSNGAFQILQGGTQTSAQYYYSGYNCLSLNSNTGLGANYTIASSGSGGTIYVGNQETSIYLAPANLYISGSTRYSVIAAGGASNPCSYITPPSDGYIFIGHPSANPAWYQMTGDASLSTSTYGQLKVTGLDGYILPSLSTGYLNYTGSAWAFTALPTSYPLSGDVTGTTGANTVAKIQGTSVPVPPASGTTVLTDTSGTLSWAAAGGSVTWANDLSGNSTSSSTHQYVSSLSYSSAAAGGTIAINGTGTTLQFAANNTAPAISQTAPTSDVATQTLSITAQSPYTGASSNKTGGTLALSGGASIVGSNTTSGASLQLGGGNYTSNTTTSTLDVDLLDINNTSGTAKLVLNTNYTGGNPAFYPTTTNTGTLGIPSALWNNVYATNINVKVATYNGVVSTTASGSTCSIDWTTGALQKLILGANTTLSFASPPPGPADLMLEVVQGSTVYSLAFATTMKWLGGTPYAVSITPNAIDLIAIHYDGSTYFASYGLAFS